MRRAWVLKWWIQGTGIAPDELDRVFDRFYRGTGAQGSGSGLGLAIASSIAGRHGATLDVRNREDGGGLDREGRVAGAGKSNRLNP